MRRNEQRSGNATTMWSNVHSVLECRSGKRTGQARRLRSDFGRPKAASNAGQFWSTSSAEMETGAVPHRHESNPRYVVAMPGRYQRRRHWSNEVRAVMVWIGLAFDLMLRGMERLSRNRARKILKPMVDTTGAGNVEQLTYTHSRNARRSK